MPLLNIIETELLIPLFIALAAVFLLFIILIIRHQKKSKPAEIDVQAIMTALGKDNIKTVEFKRQKIVVAVKQYRAVDLEALKTSGAVGINVVGNTIKFYYEHNNEQIVEAMKERVD